MKFDREKAECVGNQRINDRVDELQRERFKVGLFRRAKMLNGVTGFPQSVEARHISNSDAGGCPQYLRQLLEIVCAASADQVSTFSICA